MAILTVDQADQPAQVEEFSLPPRSHAVSVAFLDPVEGDLRSDLTLVLTHRELARLLTIATETGCRFERECLTFDPLAWLYTPRQIFGDRAAVDACRERESFIRGLLLHGLSLGLDTEPATLDELLRDDPEDEVPVMPEGARVN